MRAEVRDDQGAVCVFLYDAQGEPAFKNPDGEILPMIIQKSDGAYLYATTDLAAIRFRLRELKAQRGHLCHRRPPEAALRDVDGVRPRRRLDHRRCAASST
jgi:hypothetical protein